jgi:hypothetical protein
VPSDHVVEELQELAAVLVVTEDRLASDSSRRDVVRGAGYLEARRAGHATKLVRPQPHATRRAAFVTKS